MRSALKMPLTSLKYYGSFLYFGFMFVYAVPILKQALTIPFVMLGCS
jgi:hypothetical protein